MTEPVSTEPIKIGGIWSTSGPLAAVGTVERDAAQLRIDEINEDGGINGREVELIVRDGESKAEVAVSAARELIESENVVAILGPESLAMQVAVGEVATAAGVPNVSAQGGKFFGGDGSEYQWSTAALGTDSLNVAKRYWEANGITKIGLIRTADALGEAAPAQVEAVLEGTGIEVVSDQQVQGTDTSVLSQMGNIKAAGAESVWVHNGGAIVPVAAQAFHELELPGFMLAFTDSVALIPAFGDAIEDYRAVSSLGAVPSIVPDDHPSGRLEAVRRRLRIDVWRRRQLVRELGLRRCDDRAAGHRSSWRRPAGGRRVHERHQLDRSQRHQDLDARQPCQLRPGGHALP